jgi:hypothetical protein
MSILTLPISDQLMQVLQKQAAQEGKSVETVALEYLNRRATHPRRSSFLDKWAGAIDSGMPDISAQHDKYLGQSHLDTHDKPHAN